jgi:hypothetical protein
MSPKPPVAIEARRALLESVFTRLLAPLPDEESSPPIPTDPDPAA